ncbi:hypothetical protein BDZ97DRAFT_1752098 [Flammula alnicola]|nr:hypothetical protein BDZ97DRAFT_1752098 [Flammula alnicola]
MKLRRLQKELKDYAPPALSASLLAPRGPEDPEKRWWLFSEEESTLDNSRALVTDSELIGAMRKNWEHWTLRRGRPVYRVHGRETASVVTGLLSSTRSGFWTCQAPTCPHLLNGPNSRKLFSQTSLNLQVGSFVFLAGPYKFRGFQDCYANSPLLICAVRCPSSPIILKDQARRFTFLIDALYESRCKIICLAETTPDNLLFPDALSSKERHVDIMMAESVAETQDVYGPNVSSYAIPEIREAPVPKVVLSIDTLSFFSGEEEQFAFKRALSRLVEMTNAAYNRTDKPYKSLDDDPENFADEASYVTIYVSFKPPHAPHLSPNYVWGVREDGPG